MKPVYQQLREYREARGITQTHIAKKTGKTVQRISAIETGGIRLTADELVELCLTGYEISPANFLPRASQFPRTARQRNHTSENFSHFNFRIKEANNTCPKTPR